jgi:hypothetical protein
MSRSEYNSGRVNEGRRRQERVIGLRVDKDEIVLSAVDMLVQKTHDDDIAMAGLVEPVFVLGPLEKVFCQVFLDLGNIVGTGEQVDVGMDPEEIMGEDDLFFLQALDDQILQGHLVGLVGDVAERLDQVHLRIEVEEENPFVHFFGQIPAIIEASRGFSSAAFCEEKNNLDH